MHKIFQFLLAFLALLSGSQASALATGYSSAVTPTPNGFGIKFASNGTPTATMGQTGTGVTVASQSIGLPLAGTVAPIALAASSVILGAQIAGPWGAAVGGLGVVAMFAVPAFQGAYTAAKMRVNPATGAIEKTDPSVCTVAPCYQYQITEIDGQPWFSSQLASCQAYAPVRQASMGSPWTVTFNRVQSGQCILNTSVPGFSTTAAINFDTRTATPAASAWTPGTVADVQTALSTQAPSIAQVQALIDLQYPPDVPLPVVTGPSEYPKFNSVQALPTGGTKTDACKYNLIYVGANVEVQELCQSTVTTPPVTTTVKDAAGNVTGSTTTPATSTTTTTNGDYKPSTAATAAAAADAAPKPVQCGVAPLPACAVKVDETGMGTATDISTTPAIDAYKPIKDFVNNPDSLGKPMPTINWAFSLPSSCGVIPVGAFSDFLEPIDVCQFQPMFHSIMSMVWMLGGLFGAISLFMKSSLQGA